MTAESERMNALAELRRQPRDLDEVEAGTAKGELQLPRTMEAIHGFGCASVAQALAAYDGAAVTQAATPTTSDWSGSRARELEQPARPIDNPRTETWDDPLPPWPSPRGQEHSPRVQEQMQPRYEGRARLRFAAAHAKPQHEGAIAPRLAFSSMAGAAGTPGLTSTSELLAALLQSVLQSVLQLWRQSSLASLPLWAWVVTVATLVISIFFVSLSQLKPPASNGLPPAAPSVAVRTAMAISAPREPAQPGPMALPAVADTGSGLREPEPLTVAAPQEPVTPTVTRSASPTSEGDRSAVASQLALLPSMITTPDAADTTSTFPTPLLNLGQIEDAKVVQLRLIELGFLFGTADGAWGPRSRKALRDFRRAQSIGESDVWDYEAQVALFSETAVSAPPTATFVGGWGTDVNQCRQAPDNRIMIDTRRAVSSGATCQFSSTQRESANEWRIRAACADESEHWSANIRLTLSGNRLTWTSERGTITYLRCPRS